MRALENDVWLYEGPPDEIGLSVPDASPEQGGYVIVCELQNSELRMAYGMTHFGLAQAALVSGACLVNDINVCQDPNPTVRFGFPPNYQLGRLWPADTRLPGHI